MSPPTPADAPRDGIEPVNSTRPEEDVIETVEPNAPADEPTPDATAQAAQADAVVDSADTESDTESATEDQAAADVMALLNSHVPLALLADLAQPEGPASPTILKDEGLPDVPWWE